MPAEHFYPAVVIQSALRGQNVRKSLRRSTSSTQEPEGELSESDSESNKTQSMNMQEDEDDGAEDRALINEMAVKRVNFALERARIDQHDSGLRI